MDCSTRAVSATGCFHNTSYIRTACFVISCYYNIYIYLYALLCYSIILRYFIRGKEGVRFRCFEELYGSRGFYNALSGNQRFSEHPPEELGTIRNKKANQPLEPAQPSTEPRAAQQQCESRRNFRCKKLQACLHTAAPWLTGSEVSHQTCCTREDQHPQD